MKRHPRTKDLTGARFGLLTPIRVEYRRCDAGHAIAVWACNCACGGYKYVPAKHLMRGAVKSCGCKTSEWKARNATKHGHYGSGAYRAWIEITRRCRNPNCKHWKHYGGRGIQVCDRWREFGNFLVDMGERPSPKHEVDRIDNNGNYEPGNCRWATRLEQMANVRTNRFVTINGRTLHMSAMCREYGIQDTVVYRRLRLGWSEADAITVPLGAKRPQGTPVAPETGS